jgi:hypothetical protein
MRARRLPGRPVDSGSPRKLVPRRIAPARQAGREQAEKEQVKAATKMRRKQAFTDAVMKQLGSVAQAHHEKKMGPLAMDPMLLPKGTPTQKAKGKSRNKKKSKIVQLLKLSALAVMSHPFGAELASWDKGRRLWSRVDQRGHRHGSSKRTPLHSTSDRRSSHGPRRPGISGQSRVHGGHLLGRHKRPATSQL